jgi:hypothetical protein
MTRDEAKAVLDTRDAIEDAATAATVAADRLAASGELFAHDRLAYAWIPGDPPDVLQVAYKGRLLGVVRNTSHGLFFGWYADPGRLGPFPTARIAAAALHRAVSTSDTPGGVH